MKYLSLLLAVCLAFVALPASANPTKPETITVEVKAVNKKTVEVALTNLQRERTDITLQSLDKNTTFYRETLRKHNGFRKRLNLKDLSEGKYLLTIQQSGETYEQVIVIKDATGVLLSALTNK